MAELVKAFGDFVAAILSLAGVVGRTRQRTAIREDLNLLRELGEFEDFKSGTWPNTWLTNHITFQIAEFSGLDLRTSKRNIPWMSVVLAILIWAPLTWATYYLVSHDHPWWAILPAVPAAVFFLATLGMVTQKEEVVPDSATEDDLGALGDLDDDAGD